MGIPQALKMIEGPIDALARLPQQELMAMAQRSPSMLKILPVVLNEKAEAAQRAANMAALAQGTPPSVTEQNVAINAQAEAQPMMQQPMMVVAPQPMPPMDAGLASLPVEESEFAGGGIVAFDKGGEAKGDVTPEVEKLYSESLGRASDVGGLQYWVDKFGKDNRVTADERAEFINAAAPEVQRRLAAGDTTLPDYMKVDPSVRYALQSKDVTTEDFKKLANYFGNQFIGGEAEDPASLTRRDYIERPRSGYDFATFLASRSKDHGAASDTKQRFASLLAPYMNAELSGEAEKRYIGGEGNEFGFVVTNPMTGEREMAYPSGPLGPTKEGIYRTNVGKHHSTIGDPDRTRYAVGLDYLVDPETGRARLVEPYLEGYQERRRSNTFPITALTTLAGMSMFPQFDAVDAIKRGIVSLGGRAAAQNMAGGGIVAFAGREGSFVESNPGFYELESEMQSRNPSFSGMFTPENLNEYVEQYAKLTAPYRGRSESETAYMNMLNAPTAAEKRQRQYLRMLEAGLGIMGGTSPYAFTNIGQGAQAALKGYGEDIREDRRQELAKLQAAAEMGRREREGKLADVTGGLNMYQQAQTSAFRERELTSRETQAEADRKNRMAVASIPDKALQVASKLMKDNPGMTYLEAVSQASQALTPRDTYNATRNAVSAAAKDANAEFLSRATFDPKLQEDMRKAAQGDKDAQKRVDAIRNKIQQDTFRTYQVQGVDLSGGRMGPAAGAGGGGRGTVDTSNPLLR